MKPLNQITKQDLIDFLKSVDKKTWAMIAGGIAASAVLWVVFIGPAWIGRHQLRNEMQNMDAQLRQYDLLNKKRLELEKNKNDLTKLFEDVKARLYKEGDIALLLGQVSKVASDAKVDMIASRPKAESASFPAPYDSIYQPVRYDFTMQGGYHQMGKFCSYLELFPKLLRIQKIHILSSTDDPTRHIAEFEIMAVMEKVAVPEQPAKAKANAREKPKK